MKKQLARLLACVRRRPVLSLLLGFSLIAPLGFGGYRAALHFYIQHHLVAAEQATDRYDFNTDAPARILLPTFKPRRFCFPSPPVRHHGSGDASWCCSC